MVCIATPIVAVPPSIAIIVGSQSEIIRSWPVGSAPKTVLKSRSPAMPTTLLMTGAHANGPNSPRALRISPSTAYMP